MIDTFFRRLIQYKLKEKLHIFIRYQFYVFLMKLSDSEFALLNVTPKLIYPLSVMQIYSQEWTDVVTVEQHHITVPIIHKFRPVLWHFRIGGIIRKDAIKYCYMKSFWNTEYEVPVSIFQP